MKKSVVVAVGVLLSGCQTTGQLVTCDNAAKLRSAAITTLKVLDQVCPITIPEEAPADVEQGQD